MMVSPKAGCPGKTPKAGLGFPTRKRSPAGRLSFKLLKPRQHKEKRPMSDQGEPGVKIVRAGEQQAAREAGGGRATAFNFTGEGGSARTWIGTVTLQPGGCTGGHHHGRHEVALYVISGQVELSWGEGLSATA